MRAWTAIVALLLVGAEATQAQDRSWHLDAAVLTLVEAWDYNEAKESLLGAAWGVDTSLWRAMRLRLEGQLLRVQQEGPDALLYGVTVGTRAQWRGMPFVELAGGVSNATRRIPPRGTTVNLLILAGGDRLSLDLAARWFHVSNNGREGRHRNPDIQALGTSIAIGWSSRPR